MMKCATAAGCETNYSTMSVDQKRELSEQYETSVETLDKAYAKMNGEMMANLKEAKEANDIRQRHLVENFNKAVDHEADILGCGRECFEKA